MKYRGFGKPKAHFKILVDEQLMAEDEAAELNLRAGTPRASYAVCKVVNKKEAYTKAKEKAKEQKVRKKITNVEEKEIQVTWGVSVNDLTHKLKRAQNTIDKGGRVALVIVAAKKTKAPAVPERQMFVQMCKQSLGEEEGKLRIWKPEVWEGPKTSVYLQGVVQKGEQQSQEDVTE
jgi:translation initiation factor IF-3